MEAEAEALEALERGRARSASSWLATPRARCANGRSTASTDSIGAASRSTSSNRPRASSPSSRVETIADCEHPVVTSPGDVLVDHLLDDVELVAEQRQPDARPEEPVTEALERDLERSLLQLPRRFVATAVGVRDRLDQQ